MHRFKTILLSAVLLSCCQFSKAQLSEKYPNYTQHSYKTLRYGLFKPEHYDAKKSYPLIVYLHGSRDTVSRDITWYQQPIQKENPVFVLTPKCDEPNLGWGDTWRAAHTPAAIKTLSLIDSLVKVYNINTNRLYLYGISMGGFGVFSIVSKEHGKFAAAYAICGGSSTDAASKLTQTPLWIFHGDKDDVVPAALSRDVYHEIVRLGGKNVKYTEYPGVKHNSWENATQEKALPGWLLSQSKAQMK
jgi:predicted peptidase